MYIKYKFHYNVSVYVIHYYYIYEIYWNLTTHHVLNPSSCRMRVVGIFSRDQGDRLPVEPRARSLSTILFPTSDTQKNVAIVDYMVRETVYSKDPLLWKIFQSCLLRLKAPQWLEPIIFPAFPLVLTLQETHWLHIRLRHRRGSDSAAGALKKAPWERVFHIRSWLDRNRILIDFLTVISENIYYMFPFCGWCVLTLYNAVRTVLWCARHDWLSLWSYPRTVFIELG